MLTKEDVESMKKIWPKMDHLAVQDICDLVDTLKKAVKMVHKMTIGQAIEGRCAWCGFDEPCKNKTCRSTAARAFLKRWNS